eukprot:5225001-Pleurochrysis_carterae.AAC.3
MRTLSTALCVASLRGTPHTCSSESTPTLVETAALGMVSAKKDSLRASQRSATSCARNEKCAVVTFPR